ncbi:hypothetical protein KJB58_10790 [Staphylococcus hyicus]|uniref:Uncharacterized protein n=1 Tax=Staphylococcus hyicus TaxID=1284 RepID=A0A418JGP5_STAHY|nr:hypothetical protein [Staphylococcus hyicus]MCE5154947.1 hypothetical protein [Staphylococcus hyicus]RIO43480.1 hypothetical protein BUZ57_10730 [Staphylococcus hyicus]
MNNQDNIKKLIEELSTQAQNEIEKVFASRLMMILDEFEKMFEKYQVEDVHVSWAEFNRYNRLNKELERIAEMMTTDYKKVVQLVKDTQHNTYIEKYFRSLYLFEYSSDIPIDFTVPDEAAIKAAIEKPIEHIRLTPTLQKQRNEVLRKIRANITEGVLNGDSYKKVAKRIEHDVGVSSSKVVLLQS